MTASTPQVTRPSRRHATIGNVPPFAACLERRTLVADDEVEHPAGAERDLGHARPKATLADRATPADRRRCRRSVARRRARTPRPRPPTSRRSAASRPAGCSAGPGSCRSNRVPSPCTRPVTAALVRSVTCALAAGQRPRDPGVDGSEAQVAAAIGVGLVEQVRELRRRRVRRDAQALLAQHEAHADRAKVLPADARADGLAGGAIPHDRRRALVRDADAVDRTTCRRARRSRTRARRRPSRPRRTRRGPAPGSTAAAAGSARVRRSRPGGRSRRAARSSRRRRRGCSLAHELTLALPSLRDEPADDADRSHQQQVEDVHGGRAQVGALGPPSPRA